MRIFKYRIQPQMMLPQGWRKLDAQMQNGDPVLWALVDPDAPTELVRVVVFLTGDDIDKIYADRLHHLATIQNNGTVAHFFRFVEIKRTVIYTGP